MPKAKLSTDDIDNIVNLLTTWRGKLTWELLIDKVAAVLGRSYTRQALHDHKPIQRAYRIAKDRLRRDADTGRGGDMTHLSPEMAAAQRRIDALQAEVAMLKEERNGFLEKFATWLYNARNGNVTEQQLNEPLPAIERHRSDRK